MLAPLLALILAPDPTLPADEAPTVGLELDLSALPDDDVKEWLEHFLIEHQTQVIQDTGLEVADDAPLVIRISVSRYGKHDVHSRANVALVEAGSDTPRVERTVECELCRDGELVMKIGDRVSQLSTRALYSSDEPEQDASAAADEPADDPPDDPQDEAHNETRPVVEDDTAPAAETTRAIGPLGYAGIGTLVVGVAGLASGIPLAVRRDELRFEARTAEIRSARPTGIVLASVGGALLATGATLVSIDLVKRRKERRVAVLPGPTVLGFSMKGRF